MMPPDEEFAAGTPDDSTSGDTGPYISSPVNGGVVSNPVVVRGGGHARRNVRLVSPGGQNYLSDEMQMEGDGHFELWFRENLKPGVTYFEVLQWLSTPSSHMRTTTQVVYNLSAPVINEAHQYQLVGRKFDLTGRGCPPRATVYSYDFFTHEIVGTASADDHGNFSIPTSLTSTSVQGLYVHWFIGDRKSYRSDRVIVRVLMPQIIEPDKDVFVGKRPPFVGRGLNDSIIDLFSSPGGVVNYGGATVTDGIWAIVPNKDLYEGTVGLIVRARLDGMEAWSDEALVKVVHPPLITFPDPGTLVDSCFILRGSKGIPEATVEIRRDLQEGPPIGTGPVQAGGEQWSVALNDIPPGPISLVAQQYIGGLFGRSSRSLPQNFKVRPPSLQPTVTIASDNSIVFSGQGHTGARVEISIVSGPVGTPPGPVDVKDGTWQTTVTDWSFGTYVIKAIQKVSDNANGWIESQARDLTVTVIFNVSEVTSTTTYQPIVSGKGVDGAKVELLIPGGGASHFPEATVSEGLWSSTAESEVGPLEDYVLHIRQCHDELGCSNWFEHIVNVPPLAPGLNDPVEDGMSPRLSGTCRPGATVYIRYSDDNEVAHAAKVTGSTWSFQRAKPFAPNVLHTVTVTQVVGEQTSDAASKTFTVKQPMFTPVIAQPGAGEKVGREVVVEGTNGMEGATLQLTDAQYSEEIGLPFLVGQNGEWAVKLSDLPFGPFTVYAVQTLNQIPSEKSELRSFQVVLLPPQFTAPSPDGKLPRNGILKGRGMPSGWVNIWLTGAVGPWLKNIRVDENGDWQRGMDLPLGHNTMRARQYFDFAGKTYESEDTQDLMFDVVPAAPFIETPLLQEHVGRWVVVSGFGVPGDTISVELGNDMQSTVVLEDRTWSVGVSADLDDGNMTLIVKATLGDFESEPTERVVVTGTYLPVIAEPAAGRSISEPVVFAGMGEEGSGQVAAWFNPEIKLTPALTIEKGQWRGISDTSSRPGGNWCRFRQTITPGAKLSDWGLSARFEVLSETSKKP